jgi:hypothetical protein
MTNQKLPHLMTTPTSEHQHVVCACGSDAFFFSDMDPSGYFCEECGRPDAITQATLDREEPGSWS